MANFFQILTVDINAFLQHLFSYMLCFILLIIPKFITILINASTGYQNHFYQILIYYLFEQSLQSSHYRSLRFNFLEKITFWSMS